MLQQTQRLYLDFYCLSTLETFFSKETASDGAAISKENYLLI